MMDVKTLWEKMKPILISHGFCDKTGRLNDLGKKKFIDCGVPDAQFWNDVFTESTGRIWLPITDDPNGLWKYYRLPGAPSSAYVNKCDAADLMRLARLLNIDGELEGYSLQTAAELLDDDMLDI
jgi:hypothetical protein